MYIQSAHDENIINMKRRKEKKEFYDRYMYSCSNHVLLLPDEESRHIIQDHM